MAGAGTGGAGLGGRPRFAGRDRGGGAASASIPSRRQELSCEVQALQASSVGQRSSCEASPGTYMDARHAASGCLTYRLPAMPALTCSVPFFSFSHLTLAWPCRRKLWHYHHHHHPTAPAEHHICSAVVWALNLAAGAGLGTPQAAWRPLRLGCADARGSSRAAARGGHGCQWA